MNIPILYIATVMIFLGLDFLGIRFLVRPVFERHIGDLLAFNLAPAVVFYLFYVGGLLWFVSVPALRNDTGIGMVFVSGAILGALAYGTYEFTNIATLKDWAWPMVATDLTWGTFLTGTAAAGGVAITRATLG